MQGRYEDLTKWYDFHARQYDASLGRYFGVDPQDQFASPYLAMGNNPVMYVDPDGELAWFVIPVIVGAVTGGINVASNWSSIKAAGGGWASFGKAAATFGVGFAAGAGATLGATTFAPAITTLYGTGAVGGTLIGGIGGGISGFAMGAGNTWINGGSFLSGLGAGGLGLLTGALIGGITGGAYSGGKSLFQGRDFLWGHPKNGIRPTLNLNQGRPELKAELPKRELPKVELNGVQRGQGGIQPGELRGSVNISNGDFNNLGLREFTKSNFRYNLIKMSGGVNPGSSYHAHHVIPHEFSKEAMRLGINVNNPANAMWLHKALHSQIHSQGYNQAWNQFFRTNPRSAQDVFNFGQKILEKFKIY